MVHKPEPELEECDCCTGACECNDCEACLPAKGHAPGKPQAPPQLGKPAAKT
ncbi:MAG: hypothetical protein ABR586_04930 [Thermoplasmatota archaeon]